MQNFFRSVLQATDQEIGACEDELKTEIIARRLVKAVGTKEFAELYCQRIGEASPSGFDLGAGDIINQLWSKTMSAFTDAMAAVVATIKASQTAIDPAHISSIDASIKTLSDGEATDAAHIADIQAGLNVLTTGLTGTASTGAPTGGSGTAAGTATGGASTGA